MKDCINTEKKKKVYLEYSRIFLQGRLLISEFKRPTQLSIIPNSYLIGSFDIFIMSWEKIKEKADRYGLH